MGNQARPFFKIYRFTQWNKKLPDAVLPTQPLGLDYVVSAIHSVLESDFPQVGPCADRARAIPKLNLILILVPNVVGSNYRRRLSVLGDNAVTHL